jgi:hypothetical protein
MLDVGTAIVLVANLGSVFAARPAAGRLTSQCIYFRCVYVCALVIER